MVGQLQLDVLISRLSAEYKVEASLEVAPFETARWISGSADAVKHFEDFNLNFTGEIADQGKEQHQQQDQCLLCLGNQLKVQTQEHVEVFGPLGFNFEIFFKQQSHGCQR